MSAADLLLCRGDNGSRTGRHRPELRPVQPASAGVCQHGTARDPSSAKGPRMYQHLWWANPGEPQRLADWLMDTGQITTLGEWMLVVRHPIRFTKEHTDLEVADRTVGVYA